MFGSAGFVVQQDLMMGSSLRTMNLTGGVTSLLPPAGPSKINWFLAFRGCIWTCLRVSVVNRVSVQSLGVVLCCVVLPSS